jgi:hypothetical protein
MIYEEKIIKDYFKEIIVKRELELNFSNKVGKEDSFILVEIGLPNKVLDFDFTPLLKFKNDYELIIGYLDSKDIIFNSKSKIIYIENHEFYLAKNLKNFLSQLYIYDYLWKVMIPENRLGEYREERNHLKYANYLENELLKIDSNLLLNDNSYYWGAKIEDIELGIIG